MHAVAEFLQRLPAAVICLLLGLSVATESTLTFGMVLPGTTALLVLGFMAHNGYLPFAAALITATASSIAGTTWAYTAQYSGSCHRGQSSGRGWLGLKWSFVTPLGVQRVGDANAQVSW